MARAIRSALLAAALLGALAPAASAAPSARASIFGGTDAAIADFPFQAAVLSKAAPSPFEAQFCGAFLLDAEHVGTAAHCVFDPATLRTVAPGDITVLVGTDVLRGPGELTLAPGEDVVEVTGVAFSPSHNPSTFDHDVAVLTLARPVDVAQATVEPVGLATAVRPLGEDVTVSGWGLTPLGSRPQRLQEVTVDVLGDALCAARYEGYANARMLCARRDPDKDSCAGDSGGPLVSLSASPFTRPDGWRVAGIVSFGEGCGDPDYPGVYSEVVDAPGGDIAAFLERRPAGDAPRPAGATELQGTAQPGQVLQCASPWTGADSVQSQIQTADGQVLAGSQYTVQSGDVGRTLQCLARATSGSGFSFARSADVVVTAAPAPAPPAVTPPPATPPPAITPPQPEDEVRPRSRVVRSTCTRTACSIQVQVTDPPPTSGVRSLNVSATLRYRSTCRRDGRRRACTKRRKLTASRRSLGAGRYLVKVRSRIAGAIDLRFTAYDVAGNRQARATTKTISIGRRR